MKHHYAGQLTYSFFQNIVRRHVLFVLLMFSALPQVLAEDPFEDAAVVSSPNFSAESGSVNFSSSSNEPYEDEVAAEENEGMEDGMVPISKPFTIIAEDADDGATIQADLVNAIPRPPQPKRLTLTSLERARLKNVRKKRARYIHNQQKFFAAPASVDPRGDVELVVCSINMEAYALREEVQRIHREGYPGFNQREATLVDLIKRQNCDLVALQGVVGNGEWLLRSALQGLVKKLQGVLPGDWNIHISQSNHKLVAHAFLVRDSIATIRVTRSFNDFALTTEESFLVDKFYRGPFMIEFELSKKGGSVKKRIQVITFAFQKNVSRKRTGSEADRIQMADALHRIILRSRLANESEGDKPVVIAIGDTLSETQKPSRLTLIGRLKLQDFFKDAPCKLDKQENYLCEQKLQPPVLVSLFDSQIPEMPPVQLMLKDEKPVPAVRGVVLKKYRKKQRERWNQAAGVFMFPDDIPLVYESPMLKPGRLAIGATAIRTLSPSSPFLWVELNW